jgi:hypothetical protein
MPAKCWQNVAGRLGSALREHTVGNVTTVVAQCGSQGGGGAVDLL